MSTAVGLIGLGWIGESHLTDLAARPDVEIRAVHDLDTGRTADFAKRFGARGCANVDEVLDQGLDAVWICTPPQHHLAPARQAFARGIPVYLEKPVARDLAEATELTRLAGESGVVCAVGYQWRALGLLDPLRAELESENVVSLSGYSVGPTAARPWFLDQAQGGGNLLERGSHQIDLVRAVAGEVESVLAVGSTVRVDRPGVAARDIDDALTLVLRMTSGAVATIVIAWTPADVPGRYGLDVVSGAGVLRMALDPDFRLTGHHRGQEVSASVTEEPFSASNSRFLAAVGAGDRGLVACTPADALATLRVALAGEEALATGSAVVVS
ncbi:MULTISPECIES: Gfo/Idh/MocA family protein [unclassified Amycolatopsis]|uniref:Gfo/Idh/MocA family protein n=1 Tax=unclassified Amycolatopsis TaxID=2618356 RepID=UPI001C69EFEC|nr:Gfo/Idh/MocA family oxidoreductase [Amycolatopsis sp. DSM 110486]QYN18727.1 Gfo/Idh/MocA family oxidoreductase [Amycolatopsis sp. DSM 110486]